MTTYREKLWPAPWLFLATALVIPASLLVFLPINQTAGVLVALVLYLGCIALLIAGSPVILITDGTKPGGAASGSTAAEPTLIAGKARLPLSVVGSAAGFVGSEATAERGPRLNAQAWLMIRGWIDPVVRIELTDKNDPAPYWLISTRHPDVLAAALTDFKPRTRGK